MSKELFFQMRELETMYSHTFTKKEAITTGENLVNDIFEKGEVSPIKVFSNLVRLKQVIDTADKTFREKLSLTKDSYNGVEFVSKSGAEKLNYEEDPIYLDIKEKLKSREDLLKLAKKSKDVIFDSEGIEVPKVSSTFNKSSITVTF